MSGWANEPVGEHPRWHGLRTALTVARAEELLAQHSRTERRRVGWRWIKVCHSCYQPRPCREERWARAELRRPR